MMATGIKNNKDLSDFLYLVDNFHDALIRECAIVARGYVKENRWLHGDFEPFDVKIFIQTQFDDVPGIEIEFEGVSQFHVAHPFDLQPKGNVEEGVVRFSFTDSESPESQIVASAMRYRVLDDSCLGRKLRFMQS